MPQPQSTSPLIIDASIVRRRGRPICTTPVADDVNEASTETDTGTQKVATLEEARIDAIASVEESEAETETKLFSGIPLTSVALLNLVAIIWGTQHSVIKTVVDDCDASAFSFARFGLAAFLVVPYIPSIGPLLQKLMGTDGGSQHGEAMDDNNDDASIAAWRWGLEMGLWMFLGYAFQAIGLEYTTAQRSGFLLYLNVKFVPFFARLLFGRQISLPTWASAFTALVGTALLSFGGSSAAFNVGDLWSVAAAAASAMFILRLESASAAVADSSALNAACLLVVTLASFAWCIGETYVASTMDISLLDAYKISISNVWYTAQIHPFALIYLGGITTALANFIQTKAQKGISAERASVIYAMDPVYGAVFANILLGETLDSYGMIGAGIITAAAATNAFLDLGTAEKETGNQLEAGESTTRTNETR